MMKEITEREEVEYSKENFEWAKKTSVCRQIIKSINDFGVDEYQRVKLIELLGLELNDRSDMLSIVEPSRKILENIIQNKNQQQGKIIT